MAGHKAINRLVSCRGFFLRSVIGMMLISGCASASIAPTPTLVDGTPVATVPNHCQYGRTSDGEWLPDATCTPGTYNPDVTQATIMVTICSAGWTATVRPPVAYTRPLKERLMDAYQTPTAADRTELDHLVPLELGGAPRDIANLWPEPSDGSGVNNSKDRVETAARVRVCAGSMTLATARARIRTDWTLLAADLAIPLPALR